MLFACDDVWRGHKDIARSQGHTPRTPDHRACGLLGVMARCMSPAGGGWGILGEPQKKAIVIISIADVVVPSFARKHKPLCLGAIASASLCWLHSACMFTMTIDLSPTLLPLSSSRSRLGQQHPPHAAPPSLGPICLIAQRSHARLFSTACLDLERGRVRQHRRSPRHGMH
jgi:hypothetical protein